jgi:hypothetical protein
LEVPAFVAGEVLIGHFDIDNECASPIAIITAPVELRLRLRAEDHFPVELGLSNTYAIAYLFRRSVGLSADAFVGDGGLGISAAPAYVVVGPGEHGIIHLTSGKPIRLAAGSYGLALLTVAVPTTATAPREGTIDLRNSVAALAGRLGDGRKFAITHQAVRIGPVAFFEVGPVPFE